MRRYINGTKGVISLFLAILMLPFASIGGVLINAARVNSAVAIFDEALCNASNSTLGTYDEFLRSRFGLLAMSQNTSGHGSGYTVQNLISETFQFYMEQNTAALSNTYFNAETEATGIYPLADTSVLLSEIFEYGKYAIPAKLVMDGFCIDDIIGSLSKNMGFAKSLLGSLTSTANCAQKLDDCSDKFKKADDKLEACRNAKSGYVAAYSDFETAVTKYNALIDEMKQKVSECQQKVSEANASIADCNDTISKEAEKHPDASEGWNALKNEKDENGNQVDNREALKQFEEEHEELEEYVKAQEELGEAQENLVGAEENLEAVIAEYQGKLDAQRTVVEDKKATYVSKIAAMASAVKEAGNGVVAAQNAYNALQGAGVDLITNIAGTVYENQKSGINKEIDEMKESQKAATERGDNTAAYLWGDQIEEANARKDEINNENTVLKAAQASESGARNALNQFVVENYADRFNELYSKIIELKGKVEGYPIADGYETKLSATDGYYDNSVAFPIEKERLEEMQGDLANDIMKSSFFALAKALIGFIKAMFSLSAWVDPELVSTIDASMYANIGGLPSEKNRSEGSQYCLKSIYETEDSQKSDYYKQLLGSYSGGTLAPGNGNGADSVIDQILNDVSALADCFEDWHWYNVFGKIKALISTVLSLAGHVLEFAKNVVTLLAEAVAQKVLLAGYVAYNIPNRTTYTGKALTGAFYKLPNRASGLQGYAFYGAETEYIMKGEKSEAKNQERVFNNVWLIRFLFDFGFVITNTEVASIAGEAGSVTFGIGAFVVYLLYIIAEPFVDTLVLVNSGTVPIWKAKLYLTPSGVTDLIGKFYTLKLTEDQKNTAYKEVVKVMSVGKASDSFAQNYADAYQSGIADSGIKQPPKVIDSLTFDYTKTLLLAMLFENREKMVNRLADVIQMEAAYYAASPALNGIGTYTFNLDESYTYLRSSGGFATNEFMPISDFAGLKMKEHVIYRGY
jgi:peptidoglycan hydrolase CwlO-like protein